MRNQKPITEKQPARRLLAVTAAFGVLLLGIIGSPATATADNQIFRKTLQSAVWVVHNRATGSGVLIDVEQRLVLTNQHVVGNESDVSVFFPEYHDTGFHAERDYYLDRADQLAIRGRVLVRDIDRDLALIQIDSVPDSAKAIDFGQPAEPGDAVHSVGNPGTSNALWVYTSGTVRSNYFDQFEDDTAERSMQILETDSPINHGDSGGPVVNDDGELVALVQSMRTDARLVSLCVDLTEIEQFLDLHGDPGNVLAQAWRQANADPFGFRSAPHEVVYHGADTPITIFISRQVEEYRELKLRRVWALGPIMDLEADAETVAQFLEENSKTKIGSWVLERTESGAMQLIYVAHLDSELEEDAVTAAIDYIARIVLARE